MPALTIDQRPRYAVFGCQAHRDRIAAGWEPESDLEQVCEDEFAGRMPPLYLDLPCCPTSHAAVRGRPPAGPPNARLGVWARTA